MVPDAVADGRDTCHVCSGTSHELRYVIRFAFVILNDKVMCVV